MTVKQIDAKNAERILRLTMIVTLLTAGVSKLFSHGSFAAWYGSHFAKPELRIHLPSMLVIAYLQAMPYLEIAIALGLAYTRLRKYFIYAWCFFFVVLEFGHYTLQEWANVNQMIPYIILGSFCLLLPHHRSWFKSDGAEDEVH
jgi:hypothetical protein